MRPGRGFLDDEFGGDFTTGQPAGDHLQHLASRCVRSSSWLQSPSSGTGWRAMRSMTQQVTDEGEQRVADRHGVYRWPATETY